MTLDVRPDDVILVAELGTRLVTTADKSEEIANWQSTTSEQFSTAQIQLQEQSTHVK